MLLVISAFLSLPAKVQRSIAAVPQSLQNRKLIYKEERAQIIFRQGKRSCENGSALNHTRTSQKDAAKIISWAVTLQCYSPLHLPSLASFLLPFLEPPLSFPPFVFPSFLSFRYPSHLSLTLIHCILSTVTFLHFPSPIPHPPSPIPHPPSPIPLPPSLSLHSHLTLSLLYPLIFYSPSTITSLYPSYSLYPFYTSFNVRMPFYVFV